MDRYEKHNNTGTAASRKLQQLLAEALEPGTRSFFKKLDLEEGWKGFPEQSLQGESVLQLTGLVRQKKKGIVVELVPSRLVANLTGQALDFYFGRFLFSELSDPLEVVRQVYNKLNPGGKILLENWGHGEYSCFPHSSAFERFLELKKKLEQRKGTAIPDTELMDNLNRTGFSRIQMQQTTPVFLQGETKQIASLTFECMLEELQQEKLASPAELHALLPELKSFEKRKHSLISLPGIIQVWGRRP